MKRTINVEFAEDAIPFHECEDLDESLVRTLTRSIDATDHDARGWLCINVVGIELAA